MEEEPKWARPPFGEPMAVPLFEKVPVKQIIQIIIWTAFITNLRPSQNGIVTYLYAAMFYIIKAMQLKFSSVTDQANWLTKNRVGIGGNKCITVFTL